MGIRETTKSVLMQWAGVSSVTNKQEICVIWAAGNHGTPCDNALPGLVTLLKAAFTDSDLSSLSPSDLKSPGQINTVDSLVDFIANNPVMTLASAFNLVASKKSGKKKKKPGKKAAKKAAKKALKKAAKKATKVSKKKAKKKGDK